MNERALARLRGWMATQGWQRFYAYRPENFAWLSGGGDNTIVAGEGVGCLEISECVRLHTPTIEAERLATEEVRPVEVVAHPWHAPPAARSPSDLEHDLTPLRLVLSEEEQERFRILGRDCARAMTDAMCEARSDWSENDLAGAVAAALYTRGIQPVVLLVAGERRVFQHRHPLPRGHPLGGLAMAVACCRRGGLVANLTRVRSFGHRQARDLHARVLRVEEAALRASRPGVSLGDVLEEIGRTYREFGHPQALEQHHQGGIAGYRPRELLAGPEEHTCLAEGMCVAWNPSLPGAKVEDTFLITSLGLENLTFDARWPCVEVAGRARPGLLEL